MNVFINAFGRRRPLSYTGTPIALQECHFSDFFLPDFETYSLFYNHEWMNTDSIDDNFILQLACQLK